MKIIKVEDCRRCPRPTKYNMKMKNVCQFKYIELDDFPNIPEWCCLEDEQDLTPALELLQGLEDCELWVRSTGLAICDKSRNEIASGKTIKELLVNLVKKVET